MMMIPTTSIVTVERPVGLNAKVRAATDNVGTMVGSREVVEMLAKKASRCALCSGGSV